MTLRWPSPAFGEYVTCLNPEHGTIGKLALVFAALAAVDFSPAFQRREAMREFSRRVATVETPALVAKASSVATRRTASTRTFPALKDLAKVNLR